MHNTWRQFCERKSERGCLTETTAFHIGYWGHMDIINWGPSLETPPLCARVESWYVLAASDLADMSCPYILRGQQCVWMASINCCICMYGWASKTLSYRPNAIHWLNYKKSFETTPSPQICFIEPIYYYFFSSTDVNELKESLYVLVKEQQALATQTATTTLSAMRLKQRLVILERYFIALNRTVFQENVIVRWKSNAVPPPAAEKKR